MKEKSLASFYDFLAKGGSEAIIKSIDFDDLLEEYQEYEYPHTIELNVNELITDVMFKSLEVSKTMIEIYHNWLFDNKELLNDFLEDNLD